jgi:hypothetical protein
MFTRVRVLLLLLAAAACSGGSSGSTSTGPGAPSRLTFTGPGSLGGVNVGENVFYSFCRPPIAGNDLCQNSTDPSGGQPPYHFQLGSGVGFPPIGMFLNLNGTLTGTPTVATTAHFSVCAVDLAGSSSCSTVALTIDTALTHSPPVTTKAYFYANWTCNNSSQCIAVMGHNTGSAGPFCSVSTCQTWEKTYIAGTCDSQPLYPIYNYPPAGTCA